MTQPIYLDHNATTPPAPEAVAAVVQYLEAGWGNPSSAHVYGTTAKRAVGEAREQVATMLGAQADELVFTSGGTEANNHALRGVARLSNRKKLVVSSIEHPAITNVAAYLARFHGVDVVTLPVDANGVVRLDAATAAIDEQTLLVSVMHANNETGVIQPVRALADLAHAKGALMHSDAAQSVGKIPVNVDALGVDLLSVAGHKFYAPKAVGALYIRRGTQVHPFVLGAPHESGRRPGTENVPYLAGMAAAAALVVQRLPEDTIRLSGLRDRFEAGLLAAFPAAIVNGRGAARLPNTAHLSFVGRSGAEILARTPAIAASTGAACKAGSTEPSGILAAMGAGSDRAAGAVRFSLGRGTTERDLDAALEALAKTLKG
jgi:cysteine desulfurase